MRIGFVTPELAPYTPGGAGAAISGLARRLASDHSVTVFVIGQDWRSCDEPFQVEWVPSPGGGSISARSSAAAEALSRSERFDMVEFVDFDGIGYESLLDRGRANLEATRAVVRVHGPSDLMFDAIGLVPDELRLVIAKEVEAFRMADAVLASSDSMANLVRESYGLEEDRVLVAPLPVEPLPKVNPEPAPEPEVVCLGRLGEVKGSHDLLLELIPLLEERPEVRLRFIGQDGWSVAGGRSMREWMESLIPYRVRTQVVFEGRVALGELPMSLSTAWVAVFPSRFEGYCLAADEVRSLGLPIVVTDIAGFRDRMSEATGALVAPNRQGSLAEAVRRLVDDSGLRTRLASAPPPSVGDPTAVYRSPLPAPRHPRSQSGLATAAGQRVLSVAASVKKSTVARLAHRLVQAAPGWMVNGARRMVPKPIRRRIVQMIPLGGEMARRRAQERKTTLRKLIASGRFTDLSDPEVSIVVPCFDQGQFLEEALTSVFLQDHDSWEVIIVDDGSTDPATLSILDGLDLPRVRLLRQENRGLSAARNAGMSVARGRLLVPLDADDELDPQFLSSMSDALAERPDAAFAHCWAVLFGDLDYIWASRPYNPFLLLMSNSVIGCVMLRKSAWEAAGGYDETMRDGNEDWELWVRLMALGWDQVEVRRPLFRYRKHGVSMSVTTESRFEMGAAQVRERHPDLYEPEGLRQFRETHYPLVSLLGQGGSEVSDRGMVDISDLPSAIRAAKGRYAAMASHCEPAGLAAAAAELEDRPDLAATSCGSGYLWRRWVLMDSAVEMIVPGGAESDPLAAARLDDWVVPEEIGGKPVRRQPVEGEIRYEDTLG